MRIIFVNRYFFPDESATSQMLSDVCFALGARGHDVHVVTSRQLYENAKRDLPRQEQINSHVVVHRVRTTKFGRARLIGRAFDYATFYLASAYEVWRIARRGDVVVAKTDPPMLSVVLGPITRLRGAISVNWLQDIFPEVAQRLGFGSRAVDPLYSILRRLRDRSLRAAKMNVVLGRHMRDQVRKFGVPLESIEVIENFANEALLRPVCRKGSALARQIGADDAFVVMYAGNLGRAHEIQTVLRGMAQLRNQPPDASQLKIVWVFVGGGALTAPLKAEVRAAAYDNVHFVAYVPRESLSEVLSLGDVHLISLVPELEGLIVPSKFYGILAAGRPAIMIGDPDGEIGSILSSEACGIAVAQGAGTALAAAVLDLRDDPEKRALMGQRARSLFEREYRLHVITQKWEQLFKRIGEPRRRAAPSLEVTRD